MLNSSQNALNSSQKADRGTTLNAAQVRAWALQAGFTEAGLVPLLAFWDEFSAFCDEFRMEPANPGLRIDHQCS